MAVLIRWVSVEIPLFDRRQGPIERAKVEADQAELRRDAAVLAAQSELQRALQQLSLRRTAVRDYEKEGLAQTLRCTRWRKTLQTGQARFWN